MINRDDPNLPGGPGQQEAVKNAILREYGNVIGDNQANNIAYIALVAARYEVFERERELKDTKEAWKNYNIRKELYGL